MVYYVASFYKSGKIKAVILGRCLASGKVGLKNSVMMHCSGAGGPYSVSDLSFLSFEFSCAGNNQRYDGDVIRVIIFQIDLNLGRGLFHCNSMIHY